MPEITLSALVVAHNEEDQLPDCLACLTFADEIVVVLDRCTDRSLEIARSFGAVIIEGAWPIEGHRRNLGLETCRGKMILEVDADERVSEDLRNEILEIVKAPAADLYQIPYDNYVGDRLVRYGWGGSWGVSSTTRLFRKGHKSWGDQRIHPKVTMKGEKRRMENRMIHYVDKDISDMLQRLDRYSTALAADMRASGDISSYFHSIRRMFGRFYKCYVGRKGYREGKYGFLIALMAGLYPILSHLKASLEPTEGTAKRPDRGKSDDRLQ